MAAWDDEDYEAAETPAAVVSAGGDRWSGEDEDEDGLKDNWDDDEEEKDTSNVPKTQPKKKKTLADKIKEKEEAKREEVLAKMAQAAAERELTPEEELEQKMRGQKMAEESDLELAMEAFGSTADVVPGVKTIDNFVPKTKEEFAELSQMMVKKLSALEYKTDFNYFLETLVRDSCAGREPEDIKKISNTLTLLANEKQKLNKDKNKGKKKAGATKKNTLATGKGVGKAGDDYYDDEYYAEYDDFM